MTPWDIAIDVSDAQGIIDWPAVRAAGIRIAFVKATEGATFVARSFERNRAGAAALGILVVPYSFLRPVAAGQQIMHFREVCGLEEGMPFALDWEGRAAQTCSAAVAEEIGESLAAVANRKPIGYWGMPGATPAAPTALMRLWPRWVPRYPQVGVNSFAALPPRAHASPELYWHKPDGSLPEFAQYTSCGRIAGINGLVDRSAAFFPSVDDALCWLSGRMPASGAAVAQGTPVPAAAPTAAATRLVPRRAPPPAAAEALNADDLKADELNAAELDRLSGDSGQ